MKTMGSRSRFDIIGEMLTRCRAGVSQTQLIRKCNLSYESYLTYIQLLLEKDFIVKTDNKYRITFRGEILLRKINAVLTVWSGIPIFSEIAIDSSKVKQVMK